MISLGMSTASPPPSASLSSVMTTNHLNSSVIDGSDDSNSGSDSQSIFRQQSTQPSPFKSSNSKILDLIESPILNKNRFLSPRMFDIVNYSEDSGSSLDHHQMTLETAPDVLLNDTITTGVDRNNTKESDTTTQPDNKSQMDTCETISGINDVSQTETNKSYVAPQSRTTSNRSSLGVCGSTLKSSSSRSSPYASARAQAIFQKARKFTPVVQTNSPSKMTPEVLTNLSSSQQQQQQSPMIGMLKRSQNYQSMDGSSSPKRANSYLPLSRGQAFLQALQNRTNVKHALNNNMTNISNSDQDNANDSLVVPSTPPSKVLVSILRKTPTPRKTLLYAGSPSNTPSKSRVMFADPIVTSTREYDKDYPPSVLGPETCLTGSNDCNTSIIVHDSNIVTPDASVKRQRLDIESISSEATTNEDSSSQERPNTCRKRKIPKSMRYLFPSENDNDDNSNEDDAAYATGTSNSTTASELMTEAITFTCPVRITEKHLEEILQQSDSLSSSQESTDSLSYHSPPEEVHSSDARFSPPSSEDEENAAIVDEAQVDASQLFRPSIIHSNTSTCIDLPFNKLTSVQPTVVTDELPDEIPETVELDMDRSSVIETITENESSTVSQEKPCQDLEQKEGDEDDQNNDDSTKSADELLFSQENYVSPVEVTQVSSMVQSLPQSSQNEQLDTDDTVTNATTSQFSSQSTLKVSSRLQSSLPSVSPRARSMVALTANRSPVVFVEKQQSQSSQFYSSPNVSSIRAPSRLPFAVRGSACLKAVFSRNKNLDTNRTSATNTLEEQTSQKNNTQQSVISEQVQVNIPIESAETVLATPKSILRVTPSKYRDDDSATLSNSAKKRVAFSNPLVSTEATFERYLSSSSSSNEMSQSNWFSELIDECIQDSQDDDDDDVNMIKETTAPVVSEVTNDNKTDSSQSGAINNMADQQTGESISDELSTLNSGDTDKLNVMSDFQNGTDTNFASSVLFDSSYNEKIFWSSEEMSTTSDNTSILEPIHTTEAQNINRTQVVVNRTKPRPLCHQLSTFENSENFIHEEDYLPALQCNDTSLTDDATTGADSSDTFVEGKCLEIDESKAENETKGNDQSEINSIDRTIDDTVEAQTQPTISELNEENTSTMDTIDEYEDDDEDVYLKTSYLEQMQKLKQSLCKEGVSDGDVSSSLSSLPESTNVNNEVTTVEEQPKSSNETDKQSPHNRFQDSILDIENSEEYRLLSANMIYTQDQFRKRDPLTTSIEELEVPSLLTTDSSTSSSLVAQAIGTSCDQPIKSLQSVNDKAVISIEDNAAVTVIQTVTEIMKSATTSLQQQQQQQQQMPASSIVETASSAEENATGSTSKATTSTVVEKSSTENSQSTSETSKTETGYINVRLPIDTVISLYHCLKDILIRTNYPI